MKKNIISVLFISSLSLLVTVKVSALSLGDFICGIPCLTIPGGSTVSGKITDATEKIVGDVATKVNATVEEVTAKIEKFANDAINASLQQLAKLGFFDPIVSEVIYLVYKEYIKQAIANGSPGAQIHPTIIARYQQHYREDLRNVRIFRSKRSDFTLCDCKDIHFESDVVVDKITNNTNSFEQATTDSDLKLMLHELKHVDQCAEAGGRKSYAVYWFTNLFHINILHPGDMLTELINKPGKALHDALPLEIQAEEYAKTILGISTNPRSFTIATVDNLLVLNNVYLLQ